MRVSAACYVSPIYSSSHLCTLLSASVIKSIGETKRAAETRMKEHKDATRLAHTEKSAIAQHVHEQAEPHDIDWQSWRVIDRARGQTERKVREALHIKLRKPGLNRDKGVEYSPTWHAIL